MTRYRIARIRKADCVDFFARTSIEIENLHMYTCRSNDRVEDRLYARMLNLHCKRINLGGTVLIDGVVDNVWLI